MSNTLKQLQEELQKSIDSAVNEFIIESDKLLGDRKKVRFFVEEVNEFDYVRETNTPSIKVHIKVEL